MSVILVTIEDFVGYFKLATNEADNVIIQAYIDKYEASYIKKILGVTLGELFIADIQGTDSDSSEIEERFQVILDPFIRQPDPASIYRHDPEIWESVGMKFILLGLIYHHYVFDTGAKHTQAGVTLAQAETSGVFSPENQSKFAEAKWNETLPSIFAIQWLCGREEADTYPEYNGVRFKSNYSSLL